MRASASGTIAEVVTAPAFQLGAFAYFDHGGAGGFGDFDGDGDFGGGV